MKKQDVDIIKCLASPPQGVVNTLAATLLLLQKGEKCHLAPMFMEIKKALAAYGKDSILARTQALDAKDVPLEVALGARSLMKDLTEERIKNVCASATAFYVWNVSVIDAVLARFGEEEISKTKPCLTPQKVR